MQISFKSYGFYWSSSQRSLSSLNGQKGSQVVLFLRFDFYGLQHAHNGWLWVIWSNKNILLVKKAWTTNDNRLHWSHGRRIYLKSLASLNGWIHNEANQYRGSQRRITRHDIIRKRVKYYNVKQNYNILFNWFANYIGGYNS